ncbi:MAG: RHS repeat-associated core domain-containing protein, partial [Anaerolineae bacterium]|nr:RHS repeat-associated core domain-containing protein [Anaerolineae bacterium]
MTDTSGITRWIYDARGRVISETKVISGEVFSTAWTYDSADRLRSMSYPADSEGRLGETVVYTYDLRSNLRFVASPAYTYVGDTKYNAADLVLTRTLGVATAPVLQQLYGYSDTRLWLTSTLAGTSPDWNNWQNLTYTYDPVGNVKFITNTASYTTTETQGFTYDALERLATAYAEGGGGAYGSPSVPYTYTYNIDGGIKDFQRGDPNGKGTWFEYQDSSHKHAVTHLGGVEKYRYDENGNATWRKRIGDNQEITLTYDEENRLIGTSGAVATTYLYDGDGKMVYAALNDGTIRRHVGNWYESRIRPNLPVLKTSYYYHNGQRVAMRLVGGANLLRWLLTDHLGGTNVTLKSDGTFENELRYYPFGDARYNPSGQLTNYRFTGQWLDYGPNIYFYGSRWYDPTIGRFLQADTIVPEPGKSQALNRYTYVYNNPLKHTDPGGFCAPNETACILLLEQIQEDYGVTIDDTNQLWTYDDLWDIKTGYEKLAGTLAGGIKYVRTVSHRITLVRKNEYRRTNEGKPIGSYHHSSGKIEFFNDAFELHVAAGTMIHEFAHEMDTQCSDCFSKVFTVVTGGKQTEWPWPLSL